MGNEINLSSIYLLITLAALWTIPWKGVALWKSARNGDLVWFIILLLVNTLGILEIIYIFFFSRKKKQGNGIHSA
jgi:hypothetical protein